MKLRMALLAWTLVSLAQATALAGPKVNVGRQWPANQLVPIDRIDHSAWDALLRKYVDERGQVAYAAWKKSASDSNALDNYLSSLSRADARAKSTGVAKKAFWINAYNAVTIKGILREYPTKSIRDHTPLVWGYHIWHDLLLNVGESKYSLHQIEHDILRKSGDARIHFGIVCASASCPRLLGEAYIADRLDEQLDQNARHFFAQSGNFRYDAGGRRFMLSSIIEWYEDDFGGSNAAILKSIAKFLPTAQAKSAAQRGSGSISYLPYDWSLNDASGSKTATVAGRR